MARDRARAAVLRAVPDRGDALLAITLAAAGQAEIWSGGVAGGSRPAIAAVALLMSLALAWRSRAPLEVAGVSLASLLALSLADPSAEPPLVTLVSVLVVFYSIAAHTARRTAICALVLAMAAAQVAIWSTSVEPASPVGIAWVGTLFGGAWVAGLAVHSRQALVAALQDRTASLERDREERARAAVAAERARIARDLHDVVTHSVSVMVVQAGAERMVLGERQASTREVLESIEHTGRQALAEMRRLVGMLREPADDPALAPQPRLAHVDGLLAHVREAGLPVELSVEGEPETLPPGVDVSAYRVIQEGLTNALKHAGPAHARVVIRYGPRDLQLLVVDDGRGDGAGIGGRGGHGLAGMRERVALYGGDLRAGRRPEGGYEVRARLPLEAIRP